MPRLLLLLALLILSAPAFAQNIKSLDHAASYRKNQVRMRSCEEIRLKNGVMDTTLVNTAEFDDQGRIIQFTEYFAGGRVLAIFSYSYDAKGKIVLCEVQHAFNDMQPVKMDIVCDENGRIIERSFPEPIRNYWVKEVLTYNSQGILTRCEQWYDQNGNLKPMTWQDYPSTLIPKDNSLTYIHDQHGLLILHQLYGPSGNVDRSWRYTYR